jgi:hypothetical protein
VANQRPDLDANFESPRPVRGIDLILDNLERRFSDLSAGPKAGLRAFRPQGHDGACRVKLQLAPL